MKIESMYQEVEKGSFEAARITKAVERFLRVDGNMDHGELTVKRDLEADTLFGKNYFVTEYPSRGRTWQVQTVNGFTEVSVHASVHRIV